MFTFGKSASQTANTNADPNIFDATDADFMAKVIDGSQERPVIIDFWAPGCGPCQTLTPILEKAVSEAKGKVALAKVNLHESPMVAQQLRVQAVPTIFAAVGGQLMQGFQGAMPASEVKRFIDELIKMSGGDSAGDNLEEILAAAEKALEEGAVSEAAQMFGAILQQEPTELRAIVGLARCYTISGDLDRARQTLTMATADQENDPTLVAARSAIDLAEQAAGAASDLAKNREALEVDANNHQARFDLALALVATEQREEAVDQLLQLFQRDRNWNDEAAKNQLMKLFEAFGPTDPLTLSGRRRLSSMIFA